MNPRQAGVPHAQRLPPGPGLGGPYAQVSSSPAATARLVTNTSRGSSEPVRLRAAWAERDAVQTCLQGCKAVPGLACSSRPPAQHQPQVAAVTGVVEETCQVAAPRGVDVDAHRCGAAGQPLAQDLQRRHAGGGDASFGGGGGSSSAAAALAQPAGSPAARARRQLRRTLLAAAAPRRFLDTRLWGCEQADCDWAAAHG